ncbi:MAG TPA: hypothetical protein VEK08_22790 [Planctomycetota bacterium]|nr:hypothetical protein [Planctomycetota bacterium]
MKTHDMFLAMVLTNAKRAEARGVMLTVDRAESRIDMLLLDGSCQPMTPPPADVLLKIIERLEQGEREFTSSVFSIVIEEVSIQRGIDNTIAHISNWSMEHV